MFGLPLGLRSRGSAAVAPPLAAAALGVFAGGGYSPAARLAFGVAALCACAATLRIAREPLRRARHEPLVTVLIAFAVLGALSAVWTAGPVERTLCWALVTAGYAALVIAGIAVARRPGGVAALAAGLAVIASLAAALGLASAALGADAYAVRIAGAWRPGGPFGYPPALALLVVSALPALLAAMGGRSRLVAGAAALGTALAGGVLALAASRTALALAVIVAGAALASAHSREQRRLRAAALCLGVAAALALGASGQSTRGAVLAAVMLLSPPVWLVARRRCATGQRRAVTPRPRCSAVATTVVAGLAVLASVLAFGAAPGRGAGPAAGFLHGRSDTWIAALGTFADDPLKGAGADAFLAGSARHQGGATITFAHSLPLESAAELGVAGLALSLGLYLAVGRLLWRARCTPAGGLLGPAAAAFLASSLVDWPWHLAGTGAVWALAAGALAGSGTVPEKTWISGRAVKHGLI